MNNTQEKNTIMNVLEKALTGELKQLSNFNLAHTADAILARAEFDRTYTESEGKKVSQTVEKMQVALIAFKKDMDNEMNQLGEDEVLLKNFVRGQMTAFEKFMDVIKKL